MPDPAQQVPAPPRHDSTSSSSDRPSVRVPGFVVSPWDPTAALTTDVVIPPDALVLLPEWIDGQDRALYRDENAGLLKTLRAEGVPVVYAYPADRRAYLTEHGAADVLVEIAVGVAGNATSAVLGWIAALTYTRVRGALGANGEPQVDATEVTVRVVEVHETAAGRTTRGVEVTGPVGSLKDALEQALKHPEIAHERGVAGEVSER